LEDAVQLQLARFGLQVPRLNVLLSVVHSLKNGSGTTYTPRGT